MAAGLLLALEIGNTPVNALKINLESLGMSQLPSLSLTQVAGGLDDIIGNVIEDVDYIIEKGYLEGQVKSFPSEADPDEEVNVELGPSQLVMYTPDQQPIIIDHSGQQETKETQEAQITIVDDFGNELPKVTELLTLA